MDEKARNSKIIYDGKEYWPESLHLARLRDEAPEALNWCNLMVGEIGSIKLWSAGEYGYWKNGSTKRENGLKEALNIISEDLLSVIDNAENDGLNKAFTASSETLGYLKKIRNFANDASQ